MENGEIPRLLRLTTRSISLEHPLVRYVIVELEPGVFQIISSRNGFRLASIPIQNWRLMMENGQDIPVDVKI